MIGSAVRVELGSIFDVVVVELAFEQHTGVVGCSSLSIRTGFAE